MDRSTPPDTQGFALAIGAYFMWGLLPLYFHVIAYVPPLQVLSHRVLWSMLLLIVVVTLLRRTRGVLAAARGRTLLMLAASAALIACNWLIYIWSVQQGHVLASSLGYFINPLVNVALGVLVLGERLRRWQGAAIGVAALGVVTLAIGGGILGIAVALSLAISFALYGLVRKVVAVDALGGLTIETLILLPLAIAWLAWTAQAGTASFGMSRVTDGLLILLGLLTAMPLLMFAAAARRLPLSVLGLFQYIAPTLQFLVGLYLGEPLLPVQMLSFALIWGGCALFAWDSIRAGRAPVPREI